jgi:lipoyl(octanoyl) transferase
MNVLFSSLDLKAFELEESALRQLDERTFVVKNWSWDYSRAHAFQRRCLEMVEANPRLRILICCNHPRVLTNGRGLQKPRKGEVLELKEFRREDYPTLPFPFYQIERGGGLTFHHPGQYIFYPILKLNPQSLSLSKMIDEIFDISVSVLESWGLKGLSHEHKLLGLWYGEKKLASMGIAIEKLTTFHGMALNLLSDPQMRLALQRLNPCGLTAETYTSVEEQASLPLSPLEAFHQSFIERIGHAWK